MLAVFSVDWHRSKAIWKRILIRELTYTLEMLKRAGLVALLLSLAVLEIYVCAAAFPVHRQWAYTPSRLEEGLVLLSVFMSCTLVAIGMASFIAPKALQDYAVRQNSKWFPTNPLLDWMKTAEYIRFLRVIGIVAYVAGLFAAFILLKHISETTFI